MTNPTNAPKGANAPALPIAWNTHASAVSRRWVVGGGAAAIAGGAGLAAVSAPSVDPDAMILSAFRRWRVASDPPDDLSDDDFEAAALVEREAGGIVADRPAYGALGVSIKLAFLAYQARDHGGYDDPEHPALRTMASLTASIPHLPPELGMAVRLAVEESAQTMWLLAEGDRLDFEHQRLTGELIRLAGRLKPVAGG